MKPRLFLHIGQPKTATTTIQTFLAQNRAVLAKEGWLYPDAVRQYMAHHLLGNFFRDEPLYWVRVADPAQCHAELMAEVKATGCDNVVMSTEALYFTADPAAVRAYFADFRVTPVVFLRRQDEWVESAYRERLKNGVTHGKIDAYVEQLRPSLDYAGVLDKWRAAFPDEQILVIPFEKSASNLPVEQQFLDRIGARIKAPLRPAAVKNETLSRDAVSFYSRFAEKPRIGPKHNLFKMVLSEYSGLHRDPPESRYFLPPATRAALVAEQAEGNRRIAAEYLGHPGEDLFSAPLPSPEDAWKPHKDLTPQKTIEIAEFLANGIYGRLSKEK